MQTEKINFLDLDREGMEAFFASIGEKSFRASQVMKWIHQQDVADFKQMNNISKSLRDQLEVLAEIKAPEVVLDELSSDGTRKWVLKLDDGNQVETVYIPESDRGTLCVSSQVGCALDCSFCSTGRRGFNRNLSTAEIISQVWLATRLVDEEKKPGRKVTNVVLMGMGEPLLNFDNVVKSVHIMMDDFAYGLSKRRVTVSTAGVVPAMDKLGDVLDSRLAVSLHATNNELRDQLVPINKKYPLEKLIPACHRFIDKQNTRTRITFEYVMLDGVNDTDQHARELVKLLKGIPTLMNLIPFNPFKGSGYKTSSMKRVEKFSQILINSGMTTVIRRTRGDDIDAACGQLVGKVEDKSRRDRRFEEPRFGMRL
ncbi:MAG: 23S rRNA (adenine(2503)-C(2))-methyltransferase RlmN [Gammaproteobacteria bacterium]|nr:23S rRNA (adenine(2503)-C(2))-methyltransferase RlmN [Gammaproteobacteria bacterium]MCK5263264.1 23S rRNA (adenine(2503)-C(2))-methyltransferase RlmN [Gammaproteobacteria bacterium]